MGLYHILIILVLHFDIDKLCRINIINIEFRIKRANKGDNDAIITIEHGS